MGCELASPLLRREILSLTSKVVQFTDILDKTVWMQLVSLVTICAETQETNGELFPNTVQLKKWYVTSTLEAAVGPSQLYLPSFLAQVIAILNLFLILLLFIVLPHMCP